jgi:predicted Rossmann fold flavoprotein
MNNYDLIIIGGGAAGQMAAISTKRAHPEASVAILDRTFALGRKILVCGAGRCNVTNINLDKSIDNHYYTNNQGFPNVVLERFGYQDIVNFFDDLGVRLYVEQKTDIGKLFPTTDQAKTITGVLEEELKLLNVDIHLLTQVEDIVKRTKDEFVIKTTKLDQAGKELNKEIYTCKRLVLSAGGKTYPALGSNGSGYDLAESFGHKIITPVPSALPLVSKNPLSHFLQGMKIEAEVTSIINGKRIKTRSDDVMFTQYGFSGPAILNISREISIHINREEKSGVEVEINFLPGMNREEIKTELEKRWNSRPELALDKSLYGLFPNKFAETFPRAIGLDQNKKAKELNKSEKERLVDALSAFNVRIDGTRGWNEAEFTAGGVDTKDVNSETLESKIAPGLFFCGEILDVDGDVGGFNLSWAWSSGHLVGESCLN